MKLLVTSKSFGKLRDEPIRRLKEAGFTVFLNEKGRLLSEEEMVEAIQGMDAVILGTEVFNRNVIDHADNLKIVSRYGVGLDKIDVDYLEEKGIALRIARFANTNSVADHTVGLMLSLCHNITRSDANIRAHVWKKPIAKDLYQSTVGILGLGAIGKAVARRLKGFDCKILAFDSVYDEEFVKEYGIQKAAVDEILRTADFLTLHLPALPEFSPLLDAEAFLKLKKDAVIINTARAKLVDQNALYEALKNGQLYGYGSDLHFMEPGFDEELIASEKTVLTPHIAASSAGAIQRMSDIAVENVLEYFGL